MSTTKASKSLTLSDLPVSEKARIGRLAREVLSLRRQVASARSSEVNSSTLPDSSAAETSSDSDDIRVALREAAASLAAADAAQRRAESRESTAQRTLDAQRELWKQREREYSQVLRAAELTLTTMRKRTADYDELVAELATYRAKYPSIKLEKPLSKQPTPTSSRRSSISAISSVPERSQDTSAVKPTTDASSTFLRLLPRELVALAEASTGTLPVAPTEPVLSRCSSTDSTTVAPISLESHLKTPLPTLADRLKELINSEPSLPKPLPSTQQKDSLEVSVQADSSEFSHPVAVRAPIQPKRNSNLILPLESADDDLDLDSAIAALKFHCDAEALAAARRQVQTPRQAGTPSTRKQAPSTKQLHRPRSIEPKSSKKSDKVSVPSSEHIVTDETLWKLVWSELK